MDSFDRSMETINKLIAIVQASQRKADAERRKYAALECKAARKHAAAKRPARKPPKARP